MIGWHLCSCADQKLWGDRKLERLIEFWRWVADNNFYAYRCVMGYTRYCRDSLPEALVSHGHSTYAKASKPDCSRSCFIRNTIVDSAGRRVLGQSKADLE
jgi:hypothetical protein